MSEFPFITSHLPGIGGKIKTEPEDFLVEEIPLYEASGDGPHTYIFVEKRNLSTHELIESASRVFQVPKRMIGVAGLKDKVAVTRQLISVPAIEESDAYRLEEDKHLKVISVHKHKNKLRIGHLRGNRFRVLLRDSSPGSFETVQLVIDELKRRGMPNYFGKQRFSNSANLVRGRTLIFSNKRSARPWGKNKFAVEVFQSYLFNKYLAGRIKKNWFDTLFPGDVAINHSSSRVFIVEDLSKELPRFRSFEISPTGPVFGYGMPRPKEEIQSEVGGFEQEILDSEGPLLEKLNSSHLKRMKIYGSRRSIRVPLSEIRVENCSKGLVLEFFLPKGAYATVLLRELMKIDS